MIPLIIGSVIVITFIADALIGLEDWLNREQKR